MDFRIISWEILKLETIYLSTFCSVKSLLTFEVSKAKLENDQFSSQLVKMINHLFLSHSDITFLWYLVKLLNILMSRIHTVMTAQKNEGAVFCGILDTCSGILELDRREGNKPRGHASHYLVLLKMNTFSSSYELHISTS